MKKFIIFALAASCIPFSAMAGDVDIDLTPGIYRFETFITVNGATQKEENYDYCIPEERAHTSLSEQLAKFSKGGDCTFSGVTKTSHKAQGNFSCFVPDFGITVNGHLSGNYSPKHYEVTARANTPAGTHKSIVRADLIGPCPEGWTPPPGISHD